MGLGNRYAQVRRAVEHDTAALRAQAVNAELWHEFHEGERVQTVDGIAGVVAAVEDGPFPGAEQYVVTLDRGLGGGAYTASQLTSLGPAQASEVHTADLDYPELGSILAERPDIAKSASQHAASGQDDCETCGREVDWDKNLNVLGNNGCPGCAQTTPYHVTVRNDTIHLDGAPHTEPGSMVFDRTAYGLSGDRYGAQITHRSLSGPAVGSGKTKGEAAKSAVRDWAQQTGKTWEDRPKEWHKSLDDRRRELYGSEY